MCRYLKYLILFTLFANSTRGQLLPFKNYSTKNGLVSDQVTAVIQDQKGLLWIGTPFGINWFDGQRFSTPDIRAKAGQLYVTNFFKDKQNNIWILSFYNGLYKYAGSIFKNYLPDSSFIGSNSNNVFDMLQYDENKFLVASDQNAFWFDGNSFSLFDPDNSSLAGQINTVAAVKDKLILFGNSSGVFVYRFENGRWKFAGKALERFSISKILIHQEKTWIATNNGLLVFNDPSTIINKNPDEIFFQNKPVNSISTNNSELWVSSDKLYVIKESGILSYDQSNGMPAIPGNTYIDNAGMVWMSSGKGLIKMAGQHYIFHDLRKGPTHSMINGIGRDQKNNLWFGTYDGFGIRTATGFRVLRRVMGKKIGYVAWVYETKKHGLLAGTDLGILTLSASGIRVLQKLRTTKIYEDEEGILWAATDNGKIYRISQDDFKEIIINPFLGDFIDAIYKDSQGFLWIGYRGKGIRKFIQDKDNWKMVREYSNHTGYGDLRIRCSYPDGKGNIIFGTRTNGMFIISEKNNDKVWRIQTMNGLSTSWVKYIMADGNDNLYISTNRGLNILSGSYDKPFIRQIHLLDEELSEQMTAVLPDREKVWIGMEEGYVEYFPHLDRTRMSAPPVYITELSINGIKDSLLPPYIPYAKKKLDPGNATIAFEFAGINLSDDKNLQYRYKLEGQDREWINAGDRNFVSYHLPPGNYVFKAQAMNSFGVWSNNAAVFSFVIPAPFWKTWWFISGALIILVLLFFLVYRYRLQQALKLERLRHRISTDLHDDIGSTLSSISILSEIVSKENDQQQSGKMIQEIKQSSVTLMEKMDDIVWSINPLNDSLENLMTRIKRFASKMFEAKEMDYHIEIDDSIYKARLNMEARQHIYLIMKEAINNLVKYSMCSRAEIKVSYDRGQLAISISDNGKGFDTYKLSAGNGLISMKKRTEAIQGQIKIISELNKGTSILLETKIK